MSSSIHVHAAQVLPARAVLFFGIAGFHALLAYLFASGLIRQTMDILQPPRDIEVIKLPDPAPNPPPERPVTKPTLYQAQVTPLPRLPPINLAPDPVSITPPPETATRSGPVAAPVPVPPPIRLIGRNVLPNTADYYPPNDIRLGNEGTAEIRSCVDANGMLEGSPTVEATSGRTSLDRAAVRLARDGKYARAMRGDQPVGNCYRFRVTFTLH